jgi:hypothetical protein
MVSLTILITLILITILAEPAIGHSPEFPKGNISLDNAWEVHDPAKSWALYCTLPEGKVQYYKMDFEAGDRILLNLIIPVVEGKRGFLPQMALVGPNMSMIGYLPTYVEVPDGYGYIVTVSEMPTEPTYEAFSPGSYYQLAKLESTAALSGQYYVAVWEGADGPGVGGEYGFPVGFKEEFTLEEMVLIPFSLLGVYEWEGQELWMIFVPMLTVFVLIGLYVFLRRRIIFSGICYLQFFEIIAGTIVAGTGMMTLTQLAMTAMTTPLDGLVGVTIFFIISQSVIGLVLVRKGMLVNRKVSRWDRLVLMFLGLISIAIWAGYIIGPLLAIIGALLPAKCDDHQ